MQNKSYEIGSAVAGTCEWLCRHEKYTTWAVCHRGLLWIKGKPGSGKPTLLKYALDNYGPRDRDFVLTFFFHGRGDELQKTPLSLFRSLLHQIFARAPKALSDLVDTFEKRCKDFGKPEEKWQWHEEELRRFFESSLLNVLETYPVWLFVDALDECGKDNAVKLVNMFKFLLKSIPSRSIGLRQSRICFSCCHYPILDLDGIFEICLEDENRKDISTFVDDQLDAFCARTSSTIPALITERASGVFMWARLVLKQVRDLDCEGAGLKKIESAVLSIPPDLEELYGQLIGSMEPASLKLIQWICFATRPLSIDELRWAMVIEAGCPHRSLRACQSEEEYVPDSCRMKRRVQTLSGGLAEVTHAQAVQFIHQSVKDFFVEKGLSALDGNVTLTEASIRAHFRFTRICVRYLAMEEIGRSTTYEDGDFPLLRYATTSWVAHTQQCDDKRIPQDDLLALFAWPSNAVVESWRADQSKLDIDARDEYGQAPLVVAAGNGHDAVVKLLISTGKVDVDARDNGGQTPLLWAVANGHWAVENWHEAVVKLLLGTGKVDVDAKDNYGQTPLSWSARNGHVAIVKLLKSVK